MFRVPNQHRIRTDGFASSDEDGNNGAFKLLYKGDYYFAIASDGMEWEHVSISPLRKRLPTWDAMCYFKELFWDEDDCVVQFHPPKSEYVNNHEFCLHLWRPSGKNMPTPSTALV